MNRMSQIRIYTLKKQSFEFVYNISSLVMILMKYTNRKWMKETIYTNNNNNNNYKLYNQQTNAKFQLRY
jgi:hypothetical protein